MQPNLSRRSMLAGVATLPATTFAASSSAASESHVRFLKVRWEATRDDYNRFFMSRSEAEEDALYDRMIEEQKELMQAVPQSLEDVALKLEHALDDDMCGDEFRGSMEGLDRELFEGLITSLRGHLAGGAA